MNVLIIYAHPNHESFNYAILRQVQNAVSKAHSVTTLDLYEQGFDPILRFAETEKYRDLISKADHIIFIFPIWWSGMPAILKGFIDRVFTAGFAYSYKKTGLKGHLLGKSAWIITTHNTPSFVVPFAEDYGKVLKNQILKPCGISPVKLTGLTPVEKTSDEKRREFLDKISKTASGI